MPRLYLLFLPFTLLAAGCYEDRIACLDPDAENYDLRADEACPDDCCNYPDLRLRTTRLWNGELLSLADTLTDGAGNRFRILRLRFYLGDIELLSGETFLAPPQNFVEVAEAVSGDTVDTEINANIALVGATGGAVNVGSYRLNQSRVTSVSATYGLPERFASVVPSSAPASSPLSTQPGLLNLLDGRGYVRASLDYLLTATDDTLRANAFGARELSLPLTNPALPPRGDDLLLDLTVDYAEAFRDVDLRTAPEAFADKLPNGFTLDWQE